MKLSIYSISKIFFQGQAKSLKCKTVAGEIMVLDHHQKLIGQITKGAMRVVDYKGQEKFFDVNSGFLEVRENNEVRCLVD